MQDGIGQQDDKIYNQLDEKIDYHLFKDLKDIEKFASEIDCVITMRYHLAILSAIFMKKCFVINHELKMSSVSLDFNYPSVNIYEFIDNSDLDILELLKNSNPTITPETLKQFYKMAKINFTWLNEK
jgi:polysaccharide pyruvyl transferase WcaK-like protein